VSRAPRPGSATDTPPGPTGWPRQEQLSRSATDLVDLAEPDDPDVTRINHEERSTTSRPATTSGGSRVLKPWRRHRSTRAGTAMRDLAWRFTMHRTTEVAEKQPSSGRLGALRFAPVGRLDLHDEPLTLRLLRHEQQDGGTFASAAGLDDRALFDILQLDAEQSSDVGGLDLAMELLAFRQDVGLAPLAHFVSCSLLSTPLDLLWVGHHPASVQEGQLHELQPCNCPTVQPTPLHGTSRLPR